VTGQPSCGTIVLEIWNPHGSELPLAAELKDHRLRAELALNLRVLHHPPGSTS
jgi:hypothetical protein